MQDEQGLLIEHEAPGARRNQSQTFWEIPYLAGPHFLEQIFQALQREVRYMLGMVIWSPVRISPIVTTKVTKIAAVNLPRT